MRTRTILRAVTVLLTERARRVLDAVDDAVLGYPTWLLYAPLRPRSGPPRAHFLDVDAVTYDTVVEMSAVPRRRDHDFRPGDVVIFRERVGGELTDRREVRRITRVQPLPGRQCLLDVVAMPARAARSAA